MLITEQHQCAPWFTWLVYDWLHRHRSVFMRNTLHIIPLSCWKQIGKYDYTTHCICWILTSWKVCCLRENNELLVGSFNAACWLYKALWPVDPCLRARGDDEVKGGVQFKPTSIWRQAVDNRVANMVHTMSTNRALTRDYTRRWSLFTINDIKRLINHASVY